MTPQKSKDKGASKAMSPERRKEILANIAEAICKKRDEAIAARKNSGIEDIWTGDDEFYQGFDDANRHEFQNATMGKPTEGGASTENKPQRPGSTLFPNITAPYVDTAAAKISDMLMPTDWRNFKVDPTPVPDLLDDEEGFPPAVDATPQPGLMPQPPMPQNPAQAIMANPAAAAGAVDPKAQLKTLIDKVKALHAKAAAAAQKAEDEIWDMLVECQYQDEMRKVIHDAARLGTGVIKGPFPIKQTARRAAKDPQTGEYALIEKIEMKGASKRVDPRNLYPDYPACRENIHNGNFIFEHDPCTEKQLLALKGGVGPAKYLDEAIDEAIKEGPNKANENNPGNVPMVKGNFPRWYYYGVLKGEELEAAGCECEDPEAQFPVIVTLVNDRVIKIALNPLEANEFPYDMLVWKARADMPWGIGVARQARVGQRMVTAATRNLMDNAGAAARPHKVMTDAVEQDGGKDERCLHCCSRAHALCQ